MAENQGDWRSEAFRRKVIQQIDEAVRSSNTPMPKPSVEMETHVYQRAKTREEYLALVARLILHVKDFNNQRRENKMMPKMPNQQMPGGSGMPTGPGMQDPINALQNMAMSGGSMGQNQPGNSVNRSSGRNRVASSEPIINLTIEDNLPDETKANIDDLVSRLIVGASLPMSLISNIHFKNLVTELEPRYQLPSRPDVQKYLEDKKQEMSVKLQKDLPNRDGMVALTRDVWLLGNEIYDTVTAYFINTEWKLCSAVLQTYNVVGPHSDKIIASRLKTTSREWNLKQPTLVTNYGTTELKTIKILQWNHFSCYGSRLNVAVKQSVSLPGVIGILEKSRNLVKLFHGSKSLTDLLLEKQRDMFYFAPQRIAKKLVSDVPNMWNSSLEMLHSVTELHDVITVVASDDSINKTTADQLKTYCFTGFEHNIAERLIKILTPIEKAAAILSDNKRPTMNKVLVSMAKIQKVLEEENSLSPLIIRRVVEYLRKLVRKTNKEEIPLIAALLSPDTKSLSFLPAFEQEFGHSLLLEKALTVESEFMKNVKVKEEAGPSMAADSNTQEEAGSSLDDDSIKQEEDPSLDVDTIKQEEDPSLAADSKKQEQAGVSLDVDSIKQEEKEDPSLVVDSIKPNSSPTSNSADLPHVKDEIIEIDSDSENEPPAKKIRCADMDEWFNDIIPEEIRLSSSSAVEEEVQRYLKATRNREDAKLSLLQWWHQNRFVYPNLAILAKKYLAIPASSLSSDQILSLTEARTSNERAKMNPSIVETQDFLKKNMDAYW